MAEMKDNEMKAWTVAVGNFDPLIKGSRKALKYINKLDGLIGIHPCYPHGTLLLFVSENAAKIARNKLDATGVQTGRNICECFVDKKYVPEKYGGELK